MGVIVNYISKKNTTESKIERDVLKHYEDNRLRWLSPFEVSQRMGGKYKFDRLFKAILNLYRAGNLASRNNRSPGIFIKLKFKSKNEFF